MEENKDKKEKAVKKKRHFDPAKGVVKIIAVALVIMMVLAACGTLLFYLIYT